MLILGGYSVKWVTRPPRIPTTLLHASASGHRKRRPRGGEAPIAPRATAPLLRPTSRPWPGCGMLTRERLLRTGVAKPAVGADHRAGMAGVRDSGDCAPAERAPEGGLEQEGGVDPTPWGTESSSSSSSSSV